MEKEEAKTLGLRDANAQRNVPSDQFVKIYANNVGLGATNWDMHLMFGEILGVDEHGLPVVEQKVKINVSKEFMKALGNLINANIKAYEEKFGPLQMLHLDDISSLFDEDEKKKPAPRKRSPQKD